jgi:hypothetical protein
MPEIKKPLQEIDMGITEEDRVRLKPILGIRPGIYLAILYSLVILIALFFLLVFPGLTNPGMILSVKSEPAGAAVRIDGTYMDTAPCEIFVKQGKRRVEVVLPGFTEWAEEIDSGSAVFGSVFFPRKSVLRVEMQAPNPQEAFVREAEEFAAWTFGGESGLAFQIPPVLSEGVYRLGPWAADPIVRSGMEETLAAAARFANTRSGLRDLLRAKFLLDNQGSGASPITLLHSIDDIIDFLEENPGTAQWLAETLPNEAASRLRSSSWYQKSGINTEEVWADLGNEIETFGRLRFREIVSPGTQGKSFYIAQFPVSVEVWQLFLNERPEWNIENREALINEGLVNSQYLASADLPGLPPNTAAWVSWFAARAWCEWYSSRLPIIGGAQGWIVRLPYEAEWELAVKTGLERTGEFWEWCEDPFVPFPAASNLRFEAASQASQLSSPERPVRGGSWINPIHTLEADARGSLPPDSCSPFVSFRPILVLER